jgi:hypothetical protein
VRCERRPALGPALREGGHDGDEQERGEQGGEPELELGRGLEAQRVGGHDRGHHPGRGGHGALAAGADQLGDVEAADQGDGGRGERDRQRRRQRQQPHSGEDGRGAGGLGRQRGEDQDAGTEDGTEHLAPSPCLRRLRALESEG